MSKKKRKKNPPKPHTSRDEEKSKILEFLNQILQIAYFLIKIINVISDNND